ncbi:MAG: hypothetical protein RL033_6407 [Pseudomonadota bacterium]
MVGSSPPEPSSTLSSTAFESVEEWAIELISTRSLAAKLTPPPPPRRWAEAPQPLRIGQPGRPPELRPARKGMQVPADLSAPSARAKLLHTFCHHELQAAELMCWALLAFADAEPAFRQGLLGICLDELRHLAAYRAEIERLGFHVGDFAVRDWFWLRVPTCATKLEFVAVMGMGLEAANLEHAPLFGERLAAVGDSASAALQARIAREELGHVRFAVHWFERWTEGLSFERWCAELPQPLSPLLLRGKHFNRAARLQAGMRDPFLSELEHWQPADGDPSASRA